MSVTSLYQLYFLFAASYTCFRTHTSCPFDGEDNEGEEVDYVYWNADWTYHVHDKDQDVEEICRCYDRGKRHQQTEPSD